jgi:hypothetical protein
MQKSSGLTTLIQLPNRSEGIETGEGVLAALNNTEYLTSLAFLYDDTHASSRGSKMLFK